MSLPIKIAGNIMIGVSSPTLSISEIVPEITVTRTRENLAVPATMTKNPRVLAGDMSGSCTIVYWPTATTGASALPQMVWDAVENGTTLVISGTTTQDAVGPANPSYTFTVQPLEVMVLGTAGQYNTVNVTWPLFDGVVTRAIS